MPIQLTDAIERAELMSDDGLLAQQSYDLILQKLDPDDKHSFSMALIDRGIIVKLSSLRKVQKKLFDAKKIAQQFVQREDSPLWVPETWDDDDEWEELSEEDLEEVDESELNLDVGESSYGLEPEDKDVQRIRSVLEANGISINSDGTVNFYKSSIPGIYKDKLPQALPLENAIDYFDQILDSTDREQSKMDTFIDLLSRLTSETYDLEFSLEELDNYQFSPQSRNEFTSGIAQNLEEMKGAISEGNWDGAQNVLETMKGSVDQWLGEKDQHYDKHLELVDVLDQLADMKDQNPENYSKVLEGVGGVPSA